MLTLHRAFCRQRTKHDPGFTLTLTLTLTLGMAQMKADRVWSVDVHDVQEFEGFKKLGRGETHACGARILHAFNMFRVRATPQTADLSKETVTYLWALQNLEGG